MQAPPGVDSDTSGEDVSSSEDTSPKQKKNRRFNWRHFYVRPDSPTSAGGEMGSDGKAKKRGAKDVMKKTVKFLMEGPDMDEPDQGKAGKQDDGGGSGSGSEPGTDAEATPRDAVQAEGRGRSTPANQTSQAMLAMLRSFVAQDMVDKRDPDKAAKIDQHRSPLGVPLSGKREKKASGSLATSEPATPATPASGSAVGSQPHSPLPNPFSVPTSPVGPNGQLQMPLYGYGWPPYPPAAQGSNGQAQASGQGYMPPPFYPHPAMLQPYYPAPPEPSREGQASGGRAGPNVGQGYLPPHLVSQLNALQMYNMTRPSPTPQQPGRRDDAPVRISRSRRGSRRHGSPEAGRDASAHSRVSSDSNGPRRSVSGEVMQAAEDRPPPGPAKPGSDKQWTKVLICLATSLGASAGFG